MSQSCAEQVIKVQYDVCHGESMCETQKSGTGGRVHLGKSMGWEVRLEQGSEGQIRFTR